MAGGIDWYRAHHGTVTDPKLGLVAAKAKARRGDVIAIWHMLLEAASGALDRGHPGKPDFEAADFLLGMEDGDAARIFAAMVDRGLIDATGRIAKWEERQVKRERAEDNTAADRKRAQRERDTEADKQSGVTADKEPCHAMSRQVTPREEERREEERNTPPTSSGPPAEADDDSKPLSSKALIAEGVPRQVAADWLRVRRAKKAPLTLTAWEAVKREAADAGLSPADAVVYATEAGWQGFKASWWRRDNGAAPASALVGAI